MESKILLAMAIAAFLLTGCVSKQTRVQEVLSEEEQTILTTLFEYDEKNIANGYLMNAEAEILESYRFFQNYMESDHSALDWELIQISPKSSRSPTGNPYDTFVFQVTGSENIETVSIEREGPQVIWDSLIDKPVLSDSDAD